MAIGLEATIAETVSEGGLAGRLLDLGFCKGERIACVMSSPLGDPRAYLLRGALIALRRGDAERISVIV
ncbi:MAG: ferrous iron transport protein A [Clostridia bacterium]|nr:ferrous iron transport protein A [Clostridia bacterium]